VERNASQLLFEEQATLGLYKSDMHAGLAAFLYAGSACVEFRGSIIGICSSIWSTVSIVRCNVLPDHCAFMAMSCGQQL
jgi:hypothetical protein